MSTYAVHRAYKKPPMPVYGHMYYHSQCWNTKETCEDKEHWIGGEAFPTSRLSTNETPIVYGYVRLIPLDEVAMQTTCSYCFKTLHNVDEIMASPS